MLKRRALCSLGSALLFTFLATADARAIDGNAPWGQADWAYRLPFSVDPAKIAGADPLFDFPVLLVLDGSQHADVFSFAKSDGSDLLVTRGDGTTVLEREVVEYDAIAQTAEIWIRAGQLSPSERSFYLYFGNAAATLPLAPTSAWSSRYRVVYHFEEDPGAGWIYDSTASNSHAQLDPARGWTSGNADVGQIGQAWNFNGTTNHIATRSINVPETSYMISAWLSHRAPSVDFVLQCNPGFWHISSQINNASNKPDYADSFTQVRYEPDPIPLNDTFHLYTWAFDAARDTVIFYFDGQPQQIESSFPANATAFYPGRPINGVNQPVGVLGPMYYNPDDVHTGRGDEFRIQVGVNSPEWILTEYRNQADAASFFQFTATQSQGVAVGDGLSGTTRVWARSHPNPTRLGTTVEFGLPRADRVSVAVYDVAGREVARLLDEQLDVGRYEVRWDGRDASGRAAAAGVYFVRLRGAGESVSLKVVRVP